MVDIGPRYPGGGRTMKWLRVLAEMALDFGPVASTVSGFHVGEVFFNQSSQPNRTPSCNLLRLWIMA
jgi:hypothetical protein